MSSLREAQKQLTRDMIVERALELFTEKGYAATTIDDIAAAAGTTRATFYAYYPSRVDLMRDFMARVNAVLDRADGPGRAPPPPNSSTWCGKANCQASWPGSSRARRSGRSSAPTSTCSTRPPPSIARCGPWLEGWHEEVISDLVRGMQLAGRFPEETRHIRGTLAFTSARLRRHALDAPQV